MSMPSSPKLPEAAQVMPTPPTPQVRTSGLGMYLKRYWELYVMLLIPIAFFITFKYGPLYGILIAFKNYNPFQGVWGSPWIGFQTFQNVFRDSNFYQVLRNTFMLQVGTLICSFPAPIIFALLLNELRIPWFKKTTQTILYLPHFISWVIIGGIVDQVFSSTGIVNNVLHWMSIPAVPWLTNQYDWLTVYLGAGVWQSAGWGTIIYLAALTGISKELYEAADVDGAGRWRKMWSITLPSIRPTIMVMLVLSLGSLIRIGFDQPYVLGNVSVLNFSQVISTYVYQMGLQNGQFGIATAVGLFQSVVGLAMLLIANFISKKTTEQGIF